MRIATMKRFLLAWGATALPFLALDAAWLSTMAQRLYRPALGPLMRPDFDLPAAGGFYLLYITGIVVFAVRPALRARGALWRGGFFGLVAYATYDLTNQATLAGWPWHITLVDLAWGTFATATAAAIAHLVTSRPSRR
jgi:uncharacterized membrane protein